MKIPSIILSIALVFSACVKDIAIPKPDPANDVSYSDHPRHADYQALLEEYRVATHSPGAILLVERQGDPLWVGATGKSNLEHQTPMRTNTPFRVGSITKVFVATMAMQLVEAGKIGLEDPITEHLPKLKGKIPSSDQITVRHLLGHLSGIHDPSNESNRYKLDIINDPLAMASKTIDQLLEEYVLGKPLNFRPGTAYSYSNTNYWLLGQIIEKSTGKNLQQALNDLVLEPLQLSNTYLERRDDRNVARGYADLYGDGKLLDVTCYDRADADGKASGGIVSTASDLKKFLKALMNAEIVSLDSLEKMKMVQLASCDNTYCEYGLGLELWRTGAGIGFGHNGSTAGIEANAVFYPSTGNLFVIFKNNGNGSDKSFLDEIMR